MKLKTLEKYIKHTNITYAEIYKRAERGGLKVEYKQSADKCMQIVTAYDKLNNFVSSCFPKVESSRDICCANWNEYSY